MQPEVIDLCSSTNSSSGEDEMIFSPIKPKTESPPSKAKCDDPINVIKQIIPNVKDNDYHDTENKYVPIIARPTQGLSVDQLFTLMIGTLPPDRICHRKPTSVTYNSAFVVDLSCVRCIDDLRADDNGVWMHGGKPRRKYCVERDPDTGVVITAEPLEGEPSPDSEIFTLVRLYHRHKATPEFQRRICYVLDAHGQTIQYAVVQYIFEGGEEVPVIIPPHGNAKKDSTAYRRTQKSTLSRIKEMAGKPKNVVALLHNEAGGSLGSSSASELPCNRRQVYNSKSSSASVIKPGKVDPLFELVQRCKEDLMPGGRKFIRTVNFDTSPSCVLATDHQLQSLVRFCTNPGAACVMGIDPTFNLGKFYVTVTTFTYSHVVNKTTSKSPTFFGPMFVHTEKNYDAYYSFFSTLMKIEPQMMNVIAVGTDGEQAIVKALRAVFSDKTLHLRCFIHMKDNIRRKLTDLLLPESTREVIVRDIFGTQQGTVYIKGLLDAADHSEFGQHLLSLKEKWDELEYSVNPHKDPQFYHWLLKNEVEDMKSSMIASVRESAGLGSPPVAYTTNRNESMNNVAKAYADYRQSNWVELADNMFDLVNTQFKEVEKAVFCMGEYRFKAAYKSLEVENSKWFLMSSDQRQKHLRRVWGMQSTSFEAEAAAGGDTTLKSLSIPPDKSGITTLSSELLERTWNKAEKLLNTAGSICGAPGMQDAMCVASDSGGKPHIVCKNKKGSFACDEACLAWKSQKLCSHVLAVCEEKECLAEFLTAYRRSKITGSYTAVSTHSQSKNVGKKPGVPKRKGPSQYKKPEIESYIDPFSTTNEHANSDVSHCGAPAQSHSRHPLPTYTPASLSSYQLNTLSQPCLPADSQIYKLSKHSQSHPFQVLPTESVSSSQIGQVNTPSQSQQIHAFPANPSVSTPNSQTGHPNTLSLLHALPMSSVSSSQICQLNLLPQNVSSSFHGSPFQIVQASQPATRLQPAMTSSQPFEIKFLTPAIKICAGCRKGYARSEDGKTCLPPPFDLCLVHKEQHLYYNVVNGKQQLSSLSNVHYHANVSCPKIRYPEFNPQDVRVPQQLQGKLQPAHWIFLLQTFGIV